MLCRASLSWAVLLSSYFSLIGVLAQEPNDGLRKVGCQVASVQQHPNASASYSIPAVEIQREAQSGEKDTVKFSTSTTNNWTFTNVLGETNDVYAPTSHRVIEQAMFLDVSTTLQNATTASDAGLSGCAFFFSLPSKDLGKDDDGSCSAVFDAKCVRDFKNLADQASLKVANGSLGRLENDTVACGNIAEGLRSKELPASCLKFKQKSSNSLGTGLVAYSPLNLKPPSSPSQYNCSDTDFPLTNASVPSNVFLQSTAFLNTTNFTLYDQRARTLTPILLSYFSNNTIESVNTQPYSLNHLVCSSPKNIREGSRVPPPENAAESIFGSVDIGKVVVWALMVNAVVFWML